MKRKHIVSKILELYQSQINYQINETIQKINFSYDADRLSRELFDLIQKYDHGFESVRLRSANEDWYDTNNDLPILYDLELGPALKNKNLTAINAPNEISNWHPGLSTNSYLSKIVDQIEKEVGYKITNIALAWAMPGSYQDLHVDVEPIRLHIPIVTNKNMVIWSDQKSYFMEYGSLYHLIALNPHAIINYGYIPRLHLIMSTHPEKQILENLIKLNELDDSGELLEASIDQSGISKFSIDQLARLHFSQKGKELTAKHNQRFERKWADSLRFFAKLMSDRKDNQSRWDALWIGRGLSCPHIQQSAEVELKNLIEKENFKTALDIGCGHGIDTDLMTQHGIFATGIDISKSAIDYCYKLKHKANFIVGDFTTHEFSEKFDLIYDRGTFGALSRQGEANDFIKKITTLLTDNGKCLIILGRELDRKEHTDLKSFYSKDDLFKYFSDHLDIIDIKEGSFINPENNQIPTWIITLSKRRQGD